MELLEVQKEADSAGRKAIFFGVGALLLAGVFGWMLARLSGGGPGTQDVVVAAEEIPALSQLTRKQLKVVKWPQDSLPSGTFNDPNAVLKSTEVNLSSLVAGEPVLLSRLSTPERGLGISQLVEPNMRAFVVQVNEAMAKAQIVHPGAFVDVVATLEDPHSRDTVSKVILQNVQVLAVGDSVDVEQATRDVRGEEHSTVERHRVVTLLVNPAEVEYLSYAASEGKIDLALRSNVDSEIVPTNGVNTSRILGAPSPTPSQETKLPTSSQPVEPHPRPRPASHPRPAPAAAPAATFKIRH